MTLVTGTVQDLGYDGMEGTLWARPARFRSDGQVVLAPERKPFKITGGVVSAELAPGPAVLELQVGSHARGTFEVVIPEEDTTLAALLDTVFPWEPAQVSLFVAEREAAEQAKVEPARIGRVIHDAGSGAAAGERIGRLAGAMSATLPELDFLKDGFNTAKLLGDMGAGSAVTNLALAVAWTHQKGHPVLVAGTTEPDRATAVVVTPPARARRVDPTKDWFRARGERHAYLPWWGLRKDVKWEGYMQGYSQ